MTAFHRAYGRMSRGGGATQMETGLTLAGVLGDAKTVLTEFLPYVTIAVAIPLGFKLIGKIKGWVTRR